MYRYVILVVFAVFALASGSVCASEEGHHLPSAAVPVFDFFGFILSNSMIITWVVTLLIILFVRISTRNMQLVPGKMQNFLEAIVEALYEFLGGILGGKVLLKTFWFFSAIFIFILSTNWFSLVPGVGSIGWGSDVAGRFVIETPLLRGGNADLNMTSAMAILFFFFWTIWAFKFNGIKGVAKEIFGVKGEGITGVLFLFLAVIFFLVGFLEVISICFRPVSLMFRLYGNIYAGEVMLESMMGMGPILGIFASLPVYFLETLVGLVQALVFALLTAVFTATMCQHENHEGAEH
ncbi:MAG: F0F1 ATP synthase subunit A [Verrucomicrobiae bacterium]|nr:F0F1 ATP synthase subunit A [Verrucomicrobiae bacterium]